MAAKRDKVRTDVALVIDSDGALSADYPVRVFRFLLSDGRIVDVRGYWADSNLRGALLNHLDDPELAIVGVVDVTPS